MPVPPPFAEQFRLATTIDIRSWSFGALTAVRQGDANRTDNVKGTLHDQQIFGPLHDFRCACGKYDGARYERMVCDLCGVKIARQAVRTTRFGHIDFAGPFRHPFDVSHHLTCFPVLPASYFESTAGAPLQDLYDQLITSIASGKHQQSETAIASILDLLVPIAQMAHAWSLRSALAFARGLALEAR